MTSAAGLSASEWASFDTGGDPFFSRAFLGAIEALDQGERHPALRWPTSHIVMRDANGVAAAMLPLYAREHSFGDFSRDWGWAEAWARGGLNYYPKLLTGVPYTPSPGPRLLVRRDLDHGEWARKLVDQVIALATEQRASSWQCLFVEERDRKVLAEAGCLLRRGVQFHWSNRGWRTFDDFLGHFTAEKRKKLKRERRAVAESGLRITVLHGDEIDAALWTRLHPMYADTFARYGNYPALPLEFFVDVGATLGRQMVVVVAWDGQDPVACAICYRDAHILYGRHWGCTRQVPGLHFELCYYQGIDYCLREGLARFEPGAQGEHKLARGFVPTETWSAVWIADRQMRAAIADYFCREDAAMRDYAEETARHLPFRAGVDAGGTAGNGYASI